MALLSSMFLGTFLLFYSLLFPLFKQPVFATYLFIFLLIVFFSYKLFTYLKQKSMVKAKLKQKLWLLLLWTCQIYMGLMMVWYIFVHFKTYRFI